MEWRRSSYLPRILRNFSRRENLIPKGGCFETHQQARIYLLLRTNFFVRILLLDMAFGMPGDRTGIKNRFAGGDYQFKESASHRSKLSGDSQNLRGYHP